MGVDRLGEFEQMVLLAVLRLGNAAYGLAVLDELERVADRAASSGSLYTTLDRLETKGLLAAAPGDASPERGGRPRRYLEVTADGRAALAANRDTLLRMWDGVESALEGA